MPGPTKGAGSGLYVPAKPSEQAGQSGRAPPKHARGTSTSGPAPPTPRQPTRKLPLGRRLQITYLLFLKMDEEREQLLGEPSAIPDYHRWHCLKALDGDALEARYRQALGAVCEPPRPSSLALYGLLSAPECQSRADPAPFLGPGIRRIRSCRITPAG